MYIFWDNSNIHYAGLDQVLPLKEPNVERELYRTYFSGLLDVVTQGRTVDSISFAGSVPPSDNALWNSVRKLGIVPDLLPRVVGEGEVNTTDHVLQLALLRLLSDVDEPGIFALLTGDGAGINKGQGFLADALRMVKKGWEVEIYSWDAACHSQLRDFAKRYGKYVRLEDYYENITFIKNGRSALPIRR